MCNSTEVKASSRLVCSNLFDLLTSHRLNNNFNRCKYSDIKPEKNLQEVKYGTDVFRSQNNTIKI